MADDRKPRKDGAANEKQRSSCLHIMGLVLSGIALLLCISGAITVLRGATEAGRGDLTIKGGALAAIGLVLSIASEALRRHLERGETTPPGR